jgi:hypothetical protein
MTGAAIYEIKNRRISPSESPKIPALAIKFKNVGEQSAPPQRALIDRATTSSLEI